MGHEEEDDYDVKNGKRISKKQIDDLIFAVRTSRWTPVVIGLVVLLLFWHREQSLDVLRSTSSAVMDLNVQEPWDQLMEETNRLVEHHMDESGDDPDANRLDSGPLNAASTSTANGAASAPAAPAAPAAAAAASSATDSTSAKKSKTTAAQRAKQDRRRPKKPTADDASAAAPVLRGSSTSTTAMDAVPAAAVVEAQVSNQISEEKIPATIESPSVAPVPVSPPLAPVRWSEVAPEVQATATTWRDRMRLLWDQNEPYLNAMPISSNPGLTDDFTLVSALFDLGRGDLNNEFKRPFSYYIESFNQKFLSYKFPKVIFIEQRHYDQYRPAIDDQTTVIFETLEGIERIFGVENRRNLEKIRNDPKWYSQAQWLDHSPQHTLEFYNPLVMSKIYLLKRAAELNPYNSRYFLFLDGAHMCNAPWGLDQGKMDIFRKHSDQFVATYFNYGPAGEIHGFVASGFDEYVNMPKGGLNKYKVVRGGILGGRREYIDVVSSLYEIVVEDTLRNHYVGTEENLFSIMLYNYPQLFHEFSNDDACADSDRRDHACTNFHNLAGNCAIFDWALKGAPLRTRRRDEWRR